MPTIISHAVVPIAIGLGLGERRIPRRLMIAGAFAAMLPDADVVLFRFGATYDTPWAHRGFSHSLGFAVALGALAALALRQSIKPAVAFAFVAFATFSHGLLDMLTNGGHGIAILWPATARRYFFDWRPIQVSPLAISRFVTRMTRVALTEFVWIWLPAVVAAFGLRASRRAEGASP